MRCSSATTAATCCETAKKHYLHYFHSYIRRLCTCNSDMIDQSMVNFLSSKQPVEGLMCQVPHQRHLQALGTYYLPQRSPLHCSNRTKGTPISKTLFGQSDAVGHHTGGGIYKSIWTASSRRPPNTSCESIPFQPHTHHILQLGTAHTNQSSSTLP